MSLFEKMLKQTPYLEANKAVVFQIEAAIKEACNESILLKGYVQSGKTATYLLMLAKLLDQDYQYGAIFTKNVNDLSDQTKKRVKNGFGDDVRIINLEGTQLNYISFEMKQKMFQLLEERLLSLFQSQEVLSACKNVTGETACLIVVRKDKYLFWFSVGDVLLYLFHTELAALGQYQVNQRQFFEWIGEVNTFEQEVPCYSVGIKELRQGMNRIFLTTDGLIECPNEPYANPKTIYDSFEHVADEVAIKDMLEHIQKNNVRDSTTIISWQINSLKKATTPSNGE